MITHYFISKYGIYFFAKDYLPGLFLDRYKSKKFSIVKLEAYDYARTYQDAK